jgi:hypothetical protein
MLRDGDQLIGTGAGRTTQLEGIVVFETGSKAAAVLATADQWKAVRDLGVAAIDRLVNLTRVEDELLGGADEEQFGSRVVRDDRILK